MMLGVQNNNRDEVHLRINISNCTKLTIKTFYFPSMKNIIFEVINVMLTAKDCPLTYGQDVIQHLTQSMNMYGMSVAKFKRMLKLLLADFFYDNKHFFVHNSEHIKLFKR